MGETWAESKQRVLGDLERHEAALERAFDRLAASEEAMRDLLHGQREHLDSAVARIEASMARMGACQEQTQRDVADLASRLKPLETTQARTAGARASWQVAAEFAVKWMALAVSAGALAVALIK
jgi:chromosome segregation ATPase